MAKEKAAIRRRILPYGDELRILAAYAVVLLHVSAAGVASYGRIDTVSWWIANALDSASRWSVPAFIMLSGALLLDPSRNEPAREFYRKRIARIAIPLVAWTLFYFVWSGVIHKTPLTAGYLGALLWSGAPYVQLYYLFVIAVLYALTPLLRHLLRRPDAANLVAAAMATSMAFCAVTAFGGIKANVLTQWIPFLGYYLLGPRIADLRLTRRQVGFAAGWFIASAAVTAWATSQAVARWGMEDPRGVYFYSFCSPNVVVMSISAFVLNASAWGEARVTPAWVRRAGAATLGVYLIHPIFAELGHKLRIVPLPGVLELAAPLIAVIVMLLAIAATFALMAVPGLRRTVG